VLQEEDELEKLKSELAKLEALEESLASKVGETQTYEESVLAELRKVEAEIWTRRERIVHLEAWIEDLPADYGSW